MPFQPSAARSSSSPGGVRRNTKVPSWKFGLYPYFGFVDEDILQVCTFVLMLQESKNSFIRDSSDELELVDGSEKQNTQVALELALLFCIPKILCGTRCPLF